MKPEMKKLIIANLPYLLFVYLFGKLGQAYRLAEGIDLSQKLLHFADGCAAAFESAAPSFHPIDLLIGVAGAAALRLMVYCKGKNAKKYDIDFTLRKDRTTHPPRYIVIFKSKQADNLEQAFKEFTAKKLKQQERPSIRKTLAVLKEKAVARSSQQAKEKIKERGLSR